IMADVNAPSGQAPAMEPPRRHKFHPRPNSLLHLPNEEPVLGYLKFRAKGTKREVFGMPIPGSLITADIQEASYYREYLAKVAQHQRKEIQIWLGKQKRTLKNVEASKVEEVPAMEPQVAAEDTDLQKALEESMKITYALPRGPLPPVVIRELALGKYQPLLEVPGKGKAKVTEEQVAYDILSLQKHKKTSPADQYIFQRHISEPTGSSRHDESPYALLGQSDSEEESKKKIRTKKENKKERNRKDCYGRMVKDYGMQAGEIMADVNAPSGQAPAMEPPVRTDEQIFPCIRWVPNGKSNCYLDLEKSQGNPIYKIVVDLLKNTNFFRAFTASSTIPSIYIQQFLDMIQYDKKAGCYRCQLDEQWFVLTIDILREALQITPVNNNQAFAAPPTSKGLINFVNELGNPKLVRNLSNVVTNDLFQPWRALLTIINLCLTGKT
nr:histone deacetylase 14 [Tanacetum cinerariifolium]